MPQWFENRDIRLAIVVVGAAVVLVLVFCLGALVGGSVFRPFGRSPLPSLLFRLRGGHGAVGTVTKIEANTITMTDRDGKTQMVRVSSTTIIDVDREHKQLQDIHVGDRIVVIGSPQDGIIQARFIRVDSHGAFPTPAPYDGLWFERLSRDLGRITILQRKVRF